MTTDEYSTDRITAYIKSGDVATAHSLLVSNGLDTSRAYTYIARNMNAQGQKQQAIELHQKACSIDQDNETSQLALAYHFQSQGHVDQALDHYRYALPKLNEMPDVLYNAALAYQIAGELDSALELYTKAIDIKPDYMMAHANLGFVHESLDNLDQAIQAYSQALKLAPDNAMLMTNLAGCHYRKRHFEQATRYIRDALKSNSANYDTLILAGNIEASNNDAATAREYYDSALKLRPQQAAAHATHARMMMSLYIPDIALESVRTALSAEPENIEYLKLHVEVLLSAGQLDEAESECRKVLRIDSSDKIGSALLARILARQGHYDESRELLIELLDDGFEPQSELLATYQSICKECDCTDDAIERIHHALTAGVDISEQERSTLLFSYANLLYKNGNYKDSFVSVQQANEIKAASLAQYDMAKSVDALMSTFTEGTSSVTSDQPRSAVFIIGMPRSGTSMIEQVLDSHPEVTGAGELPFMQRLAGRLHQSIGTEKRYPQCMSLLDDKTIEKLASYYIDNASSIAGDNRYITDKHPMNFLHVGLIRKIMPTARIIHLTRHPLDVIVSCYYSDFGSHYPWLYDIEEIIRVYNAYYRLMSYWKKLYPDAIHEVSYEEFIADQAGCTERLLSYLGLEMHAGCIDFHTNERFVWTTSYQQVKQPLYSSSVARWKRTRQFTDKYNHLIDEEIRERYGISV